MKGASSSYYSRDRDSSYSDSTRTPYIQEDESMMTYYSDESMERRQNKKLTYDTFVPMDSDSSRGSTSMSGRRGWRKQGLSIDTRNHHKEDNEHDDEAEEAAKKTLSPGMVDTENIRNIRRQRLARMARNRNERHEKDEDEENRYGRNHYGSTRSLSPAKPSRYMPSPIVEERSERSFSVSPRKHSQYASDQMAHDESHYSSPSKTRPYSASPRAVLSPQSRSSPQKSGGAFEPYKSPSKMTSPNNGKRGYNFDFPDEDDNESYNAASRGASSNATRASGENLEEDEREDQYQSRRYEADARDDDVYSRLFESDSSSVEAKPSNDSDAVAYASSPSNHYETTKKQEIYDDEEDPYRESTERDRDDHFDHGDGYERHHPSPQRDERRDEAREDYDTSRYHASNHWEPQEEESGRPNVSPSKGRDMRRHHPSAREESQIATTYQTNAGHDNNAMTHTEGRRHPSQNSDRWRYVPEPSPKESIQAHMTQAYMSPHGYQNPQYAAMANHNARHALLRRYGSNPTGPMRSPMAQQFGPMPPPSPRQQPTSMQPSMHPSAPRQPSSMHTPMPQQYQIRTHTTRKVVMPVVEDDSGRSSGRRMSPMIEDHSYLSVESHSVLNSSVNNGAGCQAIQCQSVMTKIWTCGTIADVDDFDPRTKILQGLAGESMTAFAMGADGKPRKALESKAEKKSAQKDEKQKDSAFQDGFIGTIEKISAEAQFLGNEATHIFSDVINGNFNAASVPEKQQQPKQEPKQPISVKSYGEDSSCSSTSSNTETHFDIGAPQSSPKKAKLDKKKSDGVQQKEQDSKVEEPKPDVTGPKSPSNGIYASVIKNKFKREQMAQRQKDRQSQEAQKPATSTKQEFSTGTDQLRDVYKHLFDTMNTPVNPLYLENPLLKKNQSSVVIEELDTKKTGMDGETVFHSFDKGPESGTESKVQSKTAAKKKEVTKEAKPVVEEKPTAAAVSGILSALENTLAQMMIPDTLSQANVEESVIGSIGGESTKSTNEQDPAVADDEEMQETSVITMPEFEVPFEGLEANEVIKTTEDSDGPISKQVMDDLMKKTEEQKTVEKQVLDDLLKKSDDLLQKTEENKAVLTPEPTVVFETQKQNEKKVQEQKERKELGFAQEVETVVSMTDADIEAELSRMIDDDSVGSPVGGQELFNYDGPTDAEILAELMGDIKADDGEGIVKSMFDDATVDLEDDQTDGGSDSLPSVLKPRVHFSNGVSKLKIISEDTSDDLESLKRAAKALEEAIKRASAIEVQRKHTTSGERFVSQNVSDNQYASENELPTSMSLGTELSFTTAVMEEVQEQQPSSWLDKMWRK